MSIPRSIARGGAIITLVVAVTAVLTGGVGLLILDAITCDFNVVFTSGCNNGGGGGGGGGGAPVQTPCTSATNSCGMTNSGFLSGGSCNATPPPDSSCPAPTVSAQNFYADPAIVRRGQSTTLYWNVPSATSCTITGGDLNQSGSGSGSVSTGPINANTTFTISCQTGGSPSGSRSINVRNIPEFEEI